MTSDFKIGCGQECDGTSCHSKVTLLCGEECPDCTVQVLCNECKENRDRSKDYKEGYEAGVWDSKTGKPQFILGREEGIKLGWNSALDQAEIDIGVLLNTEIGITAKEEQLIHNVFSGLKKQ